jgi:type III restriction enzyme
VPPCFIVICNNTSASKLVYDYISGFQRQSEDGSSKPEFGRLPLFRNHDEHGNPLPRLRTLLIAGKQLESGEALDDNFRAVMNTVGNRADWASRNSWRRVGIYVDPDWDANIVTLVLGVRVVGTQLLCEQVIGRALRRRSYDLNEENLVNVEYADVLGIRGYSTTSASAWKWSSRT